MTQTAIITVLATAIAAISFVSNAAAFAADDEESTLIEVKIRLRQPIVGELVKNDDAGVTLIDLKTARQVTIDKDKVWELKHPLSVAEATEIVGLSPVIAWKLGQLQGKKGPVGKVAKVTPQVVYVTLSSKDGLEVNDSLTVYRNKGEIKDPDSGAVLGIERPRIAELKVSEVTDTFAKATIQSDFEVALEVGDEVEPPSGSKLRVAVCPFQLSDSPLSGIGSRVANEKLSESILTTLVQRGVSVVERSVLDTVLTELTRQQGQSFDTGKAQQLGKLAGATVVLTGNVVPDEVSLRSSRNSASQKRFATAYLRAVDVGTGEILFAVSEKRLLEEWQSLGISIGAMQQQPSFPDGTVEHNGHHYWKSQDGMKWEDAQKKCEQMGGHLVTINSPAEQEFLVKFTQPLRPAVNVWIGLTRKGNRLLWVDGTPLGYAPWASVRDERLSKQFDHFIMGRRKEGKWEPSPNDTHHFVCEWDE